MRRMMSLLLTLLLFSLCAMAEAPDTITFTDPVLEAMIRKQMGRQEGDITAAEAETVIDLNMNRKAEGDPAIRDISSLAPFVNLSHLSLIGHEITDIGVLENMWNLKTLDLGGNRVTDLSPLSKLPLEVLAVWGNGVIDITALAPIETLNLLMLNDNKIADFSPIQKLANLQYLYIRCNATDDYSALEGIYPQLKEFDFDVLTTPFEKSEVIRFGDPVLEQKVRDTLNIHDRDVTAGDAALLRDLNADTDQNAPDESRIHDISALKYFVNLETLSLNNNAVADISALAGLVKLKALWMLGGPPLDLQPIAGMTRMVWLGIIGNMQDTDFVANMPELESLRIDGLRNLPSGLPALHKLKEFVSLGGELTDISLLAQIPTLEVVDLSWNLVSDVTPLANLPLRKLYLSGCPVEDYSPLKELYPNLVGRSFEIFDLAEPGNPDEIVAFPDPALEKKVREALGKPEGDITAKDAAQVTALRIQNEWQPQIPDDVIIKDIRGLEYFINLRELDAGFNDIGDLTSLAGLSELKKLNLGGNSIRDISLLAGLVNLEELTLWGNGIRDVSSLSGLTYLRSLHIGGLSVNDIAPLAGLTNIDHLYAGACGVEDISPLAGMNKMYRLELSDNYITDLTPLAGMSNLIMLKLANNPVLDYSPIQALYPQLQEKDFELGQVFDVILPLKAEDPDAEVPISDAGLEAILREATGVYGSALTQKDLCTIGKLVPGDQSLWENVSDLSPLRYCLNMEGIVIDRSQVSDLSPLSGLTKLRGIRIDNSLVSDLSPLAGLLSLTGVEFPRNQIEDISALATLPRLERVELIDNRIADFSPLQDLKNLVELYIQWNGTQDASVLKDLAGGLKGKDFDTDQPLELNSWFFRDPDMIQSENPDEVVVFTDPVFERRVREMMGIPEGDITARDAAGVDGLDFNMEWQENIPDNVRIHNLTGIEYFINLKYLSLNFHAVSDISMLPGLTRIDNVGLGCNGITDLSVFASMPNLRYLILFGNGITDISPLIGLTQLSMLKIEQNQIADISPLAGMTELAELNLSDNMVADFSPLQGLPNLKMLQIQRNGTQDASGLKELAGRLAQKDFEPDQPLELNPWLGGGTGDNGVKGGDPDMLQPKDPDKVIKIADKVMERRIRETIGKPEGKLTAGDAASVVELYLGNEYQDKFPKGSQIADLGGIEHFINLRRLDISWNRIKDIKKLSGLTRLEYLKAFGNQITSVAPLKDLVNLNNLNIGGNKLTKIDALAGLFSLNELHLNDNKLTNISALAELKNLTVLNLSNNKIKDFSPLDSIYPRLGEKDFSLGE